MQPGNRLSGGRAVVAARQDDTAPDTREIRRLATAAGFEVVDAVTQRRREDRTYNLGRGKAETLAERVEETDADAVVFDGELTPGQHGDLRGLMPVGTRVIDRYRLVLEIFAAGAGDERAKKQVQLATLEYEFPRLRQETEVQAMSSRTEKGSAVFDVDDRIDQLRADLASLSADAAERRAERREHGFDLVAVAGYTNAGKSTLLHRLADELSLSELEATHADEAVAANTEDQLFETLETTTRRATVDDRRLLVTDTVGLIDDLPHDLVESFSATLGEIADSDAVLAVVDAASDADQFRRRTETTLDVLAGEADRVVPVLNKADRVTDETLAARAETVRRLAPDAAHPVAISALHGDGVDDLRAALSAALPTETAEFRLPNTGETQGLLSWLHDRGTAAVEYEGDSVVVTFSARPSVVREARRRAESVAA
jgi:GTP-binding protein HflX